MRDMLHWFCLRCACPWACRGSSFFSPRVFFVDLRFADINLLLAVVSGLVCISVCVTCCNGVACVVLGLVAVPTFFSPRPFFWISCLADIYLLQVVVSGLICIWACVTCCICGDCVVVVLCFVAVPSFFLLAPLFGDLISR